jgi:hypothetical protein
MTRAKKDSAKPRREAGKPKLKKESVRDLDPDAKGRQVKGGARIMSNRAGEGEC